MAHVEQMERIKAVYDRWRILLGLDEWEVTRNFNDGSFVRGDGRPSDRALAVTDVDWEYRRASITFNTRLTEDESDDEIEYLVVHEAMHVLLNGLRAIRNADNEHGKEYERLFEEHTCTTLAWAFIRTAKLQIEFATAALPVPATNKGGKD